MGWVRQAKRVFVYKIELKTDRPVFHLCPSLGYYDLACAYETGMQKHYGNGVNHLLALPILNTFDINFILRNKYLGILGDI